MKLILVGGNEWQKPDGVDEYLAGVAGSLLDLFSYASDDPRPVIELATNCYQKFGTAVRPHGDEDLLTPPASLAKLAYLSGGHPDKLRDALKGSKLWPVILEEFHQNQVAIAGSSAGAMVLFEQMMAHGSRGQAGTELTHGLGIVKGDRLFVPHWNTADERWKTALIDTYDKHLVLCVDENTAIAWEYGEAKVLGLGKVVVFDALVRNEYRPGDQFKLDLRFD